jgi:hypothetical protein
MTEESNKAIIEELEKSEDFTIDGIVPVCDAASVAKKSNHQCFGKKPGSVIGRSGMTIGTGVDLGQMNEYDLHRLRLPHDLYMKLKPYLGIRKAEALKLPPLTLLAGEAKLLSDKVKLVIISKIIKRYEKESGKVFDSLSPKVQAAIIDYFYQWGPDGMLEKPHSDLWDSIKRNDWVSVTDFLDSLEDYAGRREQESDLIKKSDEYKNQVIKLRSQLNH